MEVSSELLNACKKDNRKAHYELYNVCYGFLMGICRRYATDKDEANALLNDGFLKIVTNLEKYKSNIPFELWIRRIMINTIIDLHRKNKKMKELIQYEDMNNEEIGIGYITNNALLKLDVEHLHQFILNLPQSSAKVFNLFVIDGYTHLEIAQLLEISQGTSKWHLNNARLRLQEMILKHAQILNIKVS